MKLKLLSKLRSVKPMLKGMILFAIGIYITREYLDEPIIGIGRFQSNFLFGMISYIFLAIAGLIGTKILLFDEDTGAATQQSRINKKNLMIIGFIIYSIGFVIFFLHYITLNLDLLTILIPISIGLVYLFLLSYLPKKINDVDVEKIMISLIFSIGLIYGSGLNTMIIPIHAFLFFSAITSSQLSREMIREHFIVKNNKSLNIPNDRNLDEAYKLSIILQITTIILLIIPIFTYLTYKISYLYLLIPSLIFFGFALYLSYRGNKEKKMYKKINLCLKLGIVFEILAILFSS